MWAVVARYFYFYLLFLFHSLKKRSQDEMWSDELLARRNAGVTAQANTPGVVDAAATFFCSVELEDCTYADGDALPCGHWFSKTTWRRLVNAQLDGASTSDVVLGSFCPQFGCNERLRSRMFETYETIALPALPPPVVVAATLETGTASLPDAVDKCPMNPDSSTVMEPAAPASVTFAGILPRQLSRYEQHCLRAYIASHPTLACCKAPGCVAVIVRPPGGGSATCPAGHRFCSSRKCNIGDAHM
jgi:hypothetical protein